LSGFSAIPGLDLGEFLVVIEDCPTQFRQQPAFIDRRQRAPGAIARPFGRFYRTVDIFGVSARKLREHPAIARVDDRNRLAA
jgi:hypothetical protein